MRLLRLVIKGFSLVADALDFLRTYVAAFFGRKYIRRVWDGDVALTGAGKVVVFNHFDQYGIIHDYVHYYLHELQALGFSIIFTTNAPKLPDHSVATLKPLVSKIIWRSNVGYDFGAFKDGVAAIPDLDAVETLLITNDSMYGPLHNLGAFIDRCAPEQADIWGVTDCWDRRFHLQSYFLLFHKSALRDPSFGRFWNGIRYFRRKRWVVRFGEIALTAHFQRFGLRCQAVFAYRDIVRRVVPAIDAFLADQANGDGPRRTYLAMLSGALSGGLPLNQTHFFWDHLLGEALCPFIKRDLLQGNPMFVPFLHQWEPLLKQVSTYDSDMIVRHMQATMRNRVY